MRCYIVGPNRDNKSSSISDVDREDSLCGSRIGTKTGSLYWFIAKFGCCWSCLLALLVEQIRKRDIFYYQSVSLFGGTLLLKECQT